MNKFKLEIGTELTKIDTQKVYVVEVLDENLARLVNKNEVYKSFVLPLNTIYLLFNLTNKPTRLNMALSLVERTKFTEVYIHGHNEEGDK